MSTTLKPADRFYREPQATTEAHETGLLDQILERVDAIAVRQSRPSPVKLTTWAEIERFAEKAAKSGMVPKDYISKPDAIVIAVQMGSELGLPPMQSLQNIAVVNGRPSVWGDAMPALCRASGIVSYIKEWSTGTGDAREWFCEVKRKDDPNPISGHFSVAKAKQAGLWGKQGPWTQYPDRMGQMRARGFGLRDACPDVLRGLISVEEAQDIPFEATGLTPRIEHSAIHPDPFVAKMMDNYDAGVAKEVPPKSHTWSMFLDELGPELAAAQTAEEVDAILARPMVQKAQDTLQNGAKDRLQHVLDEAIKRTAGDLPGFMDGEDDPGDVALADELVDLFRAAQSVKEHLVLVDANLAQTAWLKENAPRLWKSKVEPAIRASYVRNSPKAETSGAAEDPVDEVPF